MELETVLPEDLLFEIFLYLPVKSLARFKCISKQWKALICSRRFIKICMKRHHEPDSTLFLYYRKVKGGVISPHHNSDTLIGDLIHDFKIQECPSELSNSTRVVGTYHGLICFSNDKTCTARVWNPMTNQLRKFDFPRQSIRSCSFVGFGFDNINADFKVVKINMESHQASNPNLKIEIFELRNTEIREIGLQVPFLLSNVTPVTVEGSSHWIAYHPKNNVLQIVRFDMDREKFVEIPFSTDMPNINTPSINYGVHGITRRKVNTRLTPKVLALSRRLVNKNKDFGLGVLKGSLCLFVSDLFKMEVWSMNCKKHEGIHVEWSRLFGIHLTHNTEEVPIGFTARDEVIIHNRSVFNNTAYDHWRRRYSRIELTGSVHIAMHQAVAYVESFVDVWPQ